MKLIFGKTAVNSIEELQKFFSHIPGTIEFDEIRTDLEMAQEELAEKYTGNEIVDKAVEHYFSDNYLLALNYPDGETSGSGGEDLEVLSLYDDLVKRVQLCVCLMGYREYALNNDATHTKTGRMARMDKDTDEFQKDLIDRDDLALMRKIQRAIDSLVRFIDRHQFDEWTGSEMYSQTRDLVLWNADTFHRFHPIEHSQRLYLLLMPMIRSVQNDYILSVIGTERMTELLARVKAGNIYTPASESGSGSEGLADVRELYEAAASPIAYLAMSAGYAELPIQLFPENMSRQFWNAGNGTAFLGLRDKIIDSLKREGMRKVDALIRYIDKITADENGETITDTEIITIAERMDAANKFARV